MMLICVYVITHKCELYVCLLVSRTFGYTDDLEQLLDRCSISAR